MASGSATALASDLKYALDPVRWAADVAGMELDDWQQTVVRAESREVALLCYRQCGKSHVTAVKAAHHLVYYPGAFVVVMADATRQSDELEARILACLENVPAAVAGIRSKGDRGIFFANGSRLLVVPDNPDGTRGFAGVTMMIVEEAAFVSDAMMAASEPYLSARRGQLVKLSTANGKRGHFYATMQDSHVDRHVVRWTPGARIAADVVATYKRKHGDWLYRQEYLCEFLEPETAMVNADVLREAEDENFRGLIV